mmetsp:Transcript_17090/g.51286  ORF Transcript_17090/g.51286 Transcript_17090/m.51286 type:complete len:204 (+) Transcript_17090:61-672(+)|eukprot:364197-Chlamydomonas_euryale.AAC.9
MSCARAAAALPAAFIADAADASAAPASCARLALGAALGLFAAPALQAAADGALNGRRTASDPVARKLLLPTARCSGPCLVPVCCARADPAAQLPPAPAAALRGIKDALTKPAAPATDAPPCALRLVLPPRRAAAASWSPAAVRGGGAPGRRSRRAQLSHAPRQQPTSGSDPVSEKYRSRMSWRQRFSSAQYSSIDSNCVTDES